jgi:hypothetical protein
MAVCEVRGPVEEACFGVKEQPGLGEAAPGQVEQESGAHEFICMGARLGPT